MDKAGALQENMTANNGTTIDGEAKGGGINGRTRKRSAELGMGQDRSFYLLS